MSLKLVRVIRNSLVLCCTLGLGFIVGFFPAKFGSEVQGIVFTVVNGLAGFFILVTSVFGNSKKRQGFVRCIVSSTKLFIKSLFSHGKQRKKSQ